MSLRGSPKFLFPETVKHEIQSLLAVNCREIVFQGRDCKEEAQFEKMKKSFHGTESHVSLLKTFMEGKAPFNCCFEEMEAENNREGNEERSGGKMLKLKQIFHCHAGSEFIVHERGFLLEDIANSRGNKITGRALNDKFRNASAAYKIALKFYNEYCPDNQLPSGKSLEDMLLYVREKMFVHFKGAKDQAGTNRLVKKAIADHKAACEVARVAGDPIPAAKNVEVEESDMPDDYLFTGFFAFVLFGPMGLAKVSLSCFTVDGKGINRKSRKTAREEEARKKKLTKESSYPPDDYNRQGVSMNSLGVAAQLELRDLIDRQKSVNDLLFIESTNHKNILTELRTVNDMLKVAEAKADPTPNEIGYLENWQGGIFDRLTQSRKRKVDLEKEADLLSQERSKRATNSAIGKYMNRSGVTPRSNLFQTPPVSTSPNSDDTTTPDEPET